MAQQKREEKQQEEKANAEAVKLCYMDDSEEERIGDAVNVVPIVRPIRWPAPVDKEACKLETRIQLSSQWRLTSCRSSGAVMGQHEHA